MYKEFLKTAIKAAEIAGRVIREGFYSVEKDVKYKGFANPVTRYDVESERMIVGFILKKYKTHSILAEEESSSDNKSSYLWIIDPLDGTVNFAHQIPFVAVSIALEIEGEVRVGVVYNPVIDEMFYAVKGEGAFFTSKRCKNKRIFVSKTSDVARSVIVTGFPYERTGRIDYLAEPIKVINRRFAAFRRLGSAAIDMAYVARGSFEGFYEENLKPWDTAAGSLIVREAGGIVTDYYGEEFNIYKKTIVASNGLIHNEMLDFTRKIPSP